MQKWICTIVVTLLAVATLAGCGTIREETAMEMLQRQVIPGDD